MKRVVILIGAEGEPPVTVFDMLVGGAVISTNRDVETIRSLPAIVGLPDPAVEADYERGGSITLRWTSGRFVSDWRPSW